MKLNLGSSNDLKPGWMNVDVALPAGFVPAGVGQHVGHVDVAGGRAAFMVADLNERWPWETSSVDAIYAHDVFEHIRGTWGYGTEECLPVMFIPGKIWALNEAHRVLRPGGFLDITVPSAILADGGMNPGAFADPTHQTFWTWDDQFYFSDQFNREVIGYQGCREEGERQRLGPAYGITAVFRFPNVRQKANTTWEPDPAYRGTCVWRLVPQAGGRRAKLVGLLEAVK